MAKLEASNRIPELRARVEARRREVEAKRKQINDRDVQINEISIACGQMQSLVEQRQQELDQAFARFPIWDTPEDDKLRGLQQKCIRMREIALGRAFWDFNIEFMQKHFADWNLACAFKIETMQYLNDPNEGFEVIETESEQQNPMLLKTDSQEVVDLKTLDERRRKESKKQKLGNEF